MIQPSVKKVDISGVNAAGTVPKINFLKTRSTETAPVGFSAMAGKENTISKIIYSLTWKHRIFECQYSFYLVTEKVKLQNIL